MGMERLVLVMGANPDNPASGIGSALERRAPWASIVWSGEVAQGRAYKLLSELRSNRISSYMSFDKKPIGDQLGLASKLMARYAIIVGEAEVAGNKFKLRELANRNEKEFAMDTFYDNVIQVIQKQKKTEKCHA
jgi:histidyl-tRNA synthetase